jgi:hypothetical protein
MHFRSAPALCGNCAMSLYTDVVFWTAPSNPTCNNGVADDPVWEMLAQDRKVDSNTE